MDKKKKKIFEEHIKMKQDFCNIEIDIVSLAKQFGYETYSMKETPQEIIAGIVKPDKKILVNLDYNMEILRFCITYFLSKDYLDKLENAEVYTCLQLPDKEAYELAKKLIVSKNIKPEKMDIEERIKKAKTLKIPFTTLL